ncbi:MAG: transglutaminase-like domain-containing protein [Sphingomonadaceae bacterium]
MRIEIDVVLDYDLPQPHDVLLQIEVAQMADQRIVGDRLTVSSPEKLRPIEGNESVGQRTWAAAQGRFLAQYQALVEVDRIVLPLETLTTVDPRALPALVVPYLLPSRYCASDHFEPFVQREFGGLEGGAKIAAMRDWIAAQVDYVSGVSTSDTTASDTFVQRQGVCRDFAHLLATFARAAMIPARLVSAYAPRVMPPDFHALVEVWLDDGWHLVDPTGMANADEVVRIAVGRDATDIAFMTVFGSAVLRDQRVIVSRSSGGA